MTVVRSPAQSCAKCRLRPDVCMCAQAPRLNLATRLIVIIHSKEWRRSTNTGHLARLAVNGGEVRLHGLPHQTVSSDGVDSVSASTLVLFPGRGAELLTPEYVASLTRPMTLLIPDGNWNQTKSMMRRVPMLHQARPVRLGGPSLDLPCSRRNCFADRMSTFQAIAQALGILEGREIEDVLVTFYRQVLERMTQNSRRAARRHGLGLR